MKTKSSAAMRRAGFSKSARSANRRGAVRRATTLTLDTLELRRLLAAFSVNDVTVYEPADGNTATARFTVSLDAPATTTTSVSYAAVPATIATNTTTTKANPIVGPVAATAASDFTATSGLLTFTPGQQTKTVDVTVLSDTAREDDEYFELRLSNATAGATISDSSGQGHIPLNDIGTGLDSFFTVTLADLTKLTSNAFGTIRNGITGAVNKIALPLVGGNLNKQVQPILDKLESWETSLNQKIEGIFANAGLGQEAQTMDLLRTALFNTFGPGGLNVLKDGLDPGNGITLSDVRTTYARSNANTTSYLQFDMNLGQRAVIDVPLDLSGVDLPQTMALDIDLDTSNGLRVELLWDLRLGFGFSDAYTGRTVYLDSGAAATDFLGNGQKVPEFTASVKVTSAPSKDANGQDIISDDYGFKGDITLGLGTGRATDGIIRGTTVTATSAPVSFGSFASQGKDGGFYLTVEARDTPTSALRTGTFFIGVNPGTIAQPAIYLAPLILSLSSNPQLSAFFPNTPFPAISASLDFSRIDPYFNPGAETLPVLKLYSRLPQIEALTVWGGEEFGFLTDTRTAPPVGVPAGTGKQVDDYQSYTLGFSAGQTSSLVSGKQTIVADRQGPSKGRLLDDPTFRIVMGSSTARVHLTEFGRRDIAGLADADVNLTLGQRSLESEVRAAVTTALQYAGLPGDAVTVSVDAQGRFVFTGTQAFRIEYSPYERSALTAQFAIDVANPTFQETALNPADQRSFDRVFLSTFTGLGGIPRNPFDIFRPSFSANADIRAHVKLGVNDFGASSSAEQSLGLAGGSLSLPELEFNFVNSYKAEAKWNDVDKKFEKSAGMESLEFLAVTLDIGGLLDTVVKPLANTIGSVLSPISDVFGSGFNAAEGFINQPIPVLTELRGTPTSILDLAGGKTGLVGQLIDAFGGVLQMQQNLTRFLRDYDGSPIVFGDFVYDKTTKKVLPREVADFVGGVQGISAKTFRQRFNSVSSAAGGLKIDLLEPLNIAKLLLGEDADIVSYRLPRIQGQLKAQFDLDFKVLTLGLGASVDLFLDAGIGYDTRGIRSIVDAQRAGVEPNYADLLDGLYLITRADKGPNGEDLPEAEIKVGFNASTSVDIYIASGSVSANLQGRLAFNLIDPTPDGKLRWDEISAITNGFNDPAQLLNLFDIQFSLSGGFNFAVNILFGLVQFSSDDLPFDTNFTINVSLQELLKTFGLLPPPPAPPARPPVLASVVTMDGMQVLRLNAGPYASQRLYGDTDDTDSGASMSVATSGTDLVVYGGPTAIPFSQGQRFPAAGIQKIVAVGTDKADTFDTSGVTQTIPASLIGGSGNDTLRVGAGNDTVFGDAGDDQIIDFGGGTNRLVSGIGVDTLQGGSGNDTLDASDADSATIRMFGGDDLVIGSVGADLISALDFLNNPTSGRDTILAGRGDDTIVAGSGNDSIEAGGGNDTVDGGSGNDTINLGDGNDTGFGNAGNDVIRGGLSDDLITGGADNDDLYGDDGVDTLTGNAGSDRMYGGGSDDLINTAFGDGQLSGGLGVNTLNIDLSIDDPFSAVDAQLTGNSFTRTGSFQSASLDGFNSVVVTTGAGNDTISVLGLDRPVTLNLGNGNDTVNYALATAPITFNGQGGTDKLNVEPYNILTAKQITLTPGAVALDGTTIGYSGVEAVELKLGRGDDAVTINGTGSNSTTIRGGLGSDRVIVNALTGPVSFIGGTNNARDDAAADTLVVNIAGSVDALAAGAYSGLTAQADNLEIVNTNATTNVAWRVENGQILANNRVIVSAAGVERIRVSDDNTADADSLTVVDTSLTPKRVVLSGSTISFEQAREVADQIKTVNANAVSYGFATHANGAHIVPSPDGKQVYFFSDSANGGDGSVQVYGRDDFTGDLFPLYSYTGAQLGIGSFNSGSVVMHPTGSALVAYQSGSGSLRVINRNATTGELSSGQSIFSSLGSNTYVGSPLAFSVSGNNLYVAGQGVSVFTWNNTTRQLTLLRSNTGVQTPSGAAVNANSVAVVAGINVIVVGDSLGKYLSYAIAANGELQGTNGVGQTVNALGQLLGVPVFNGTQQFTDPIFGVMGGSVSTGTRLYFTDIGSAPLMTPRVIAININGSGGIDLLDNGTHVSGFVAARAQPLSIISGSVLVIPSQPTTAGFRGTSYIRVLNANGTFSVSTNPDQATGSAAVASPDGRHLYSQDDPRAGQQPTIYRQARNGIFSNGLRSIVTNQTLTTPITGYDDAYSGGSDQLYGPLAFGISTGGALVSFGRDTSTQERFQSAGIAHPRGAGLLGATSVVPWLVSQGGEQWMIVTSPTQKTLTQFRYRPTNVTGGSTPVLEQFGAPITLANGRTPQFVASDEVIGRLFVTGTDGSLFIYNDSGGVPTLAVGYPLDAGAITALASTNAGARVLMSDPTPGGNILRWFDVASATSFSITTARTYAKLIYQSITADTGYVYAADSVGNQVDVYFLNRTANSITLVDSQVNGVNGVTGLGGVNSLTLARGGQFLVATSSTEDSGTVFALGRGGKLTFLQRLANNAGGLSGFDGMRAVVPESEGFSTVTRPNNGSAPALLNFALRAPGESPLIKQVTIPGTPVQGNVTVTGLIGSLRDIDVTPVIFTAGNSNAHIVDLIAPNGTTVRLLDGTQGINLVNLSNITFDDQATQSIVGQTGNVSGRFRPQNPLSTFNGIDPTGVWTLRVEAANGISRLESFRLSINAGVDSVDVPVAIPDNGGPAAISSIRLSEATPGLVRGVKVKLNIPHTYMGDLVVDLVGPNGVRVNLATNVGLNRNGFLGTTFDDAATLLASDLSNTANPQSGSYVPAGFLSSFNGIRPGGEWRIEVRDTANADVGTIVGWTLFLETTAGKAVVIETSGIETGGFTGGNAGEELLVRNTTFSNVQIDLAGGDDRAVIDGQNTVTLQGGAGNDIIEVFNAAGSITVNAGNDSDVVNIASSQAASNIVVDGGAGNDDIRIDLFNVKGNATLGGGADTDTLQAATNGTSLVSTGPTSGSGTVSYSGRFAAVPYNTIESVSGILPPTVTLTVPSIAEGATLNLTAAITNIGTRTLDRVDWDIDNDGIFGDARGTGPTFAWNSLYALGLNDNGTYRLTARATFTDGTVAFGTASLVITNTVPFIEITGPATFDQYTTQTFTFRGINDPGNDRISKWRIIWETGDPFEEIVGSEITVSHTFTKSSTGYNLIALAFDDDNTIIAGKSIVVNASTVPVRSAILSATTINEGGAVTLTPDVSGGSASGITQTVINWGDGITQTFTGLLSTPQNHTYADNGSFNVVVSYTEGNGAISQSTPIGVAVTDVAPAMTASLSGSLFAEGSNVTLNASALDAGADVVTEWRIDWGDGTPVEIVTATPPASSGAPYLLTRQHRYTANGDFVANVTAVNEDGAFVKTAGTLTVYDISPAVTLSTPTPVNEGATLTLTVTPSDPGDLVDKLYVDWGDADGTFTEIDNAGGRPRDLYHVYRDSGTFTARVYGIAAGSFSPVVSRSISVVEVDPTPVIRFVDTALGNLAGTSTIPEGSTVNLELSTGETGNDFHNGWTVTWGDGQTSNVPLDRTVDVSVKIRGSVVTLLVDGRTVGTYQYTAPITAGGVGLSTQGGGVSFDDLVFTSPTGPQLYAENFNTTAGNLNVRSGTFTRTNNASLASANALAVTPFSVASTVATTSVIDLKTIAGNLDPAAVLAGVTGYSINWGDGSPIETKSFNASTTADDLLVEHVYATAGNFTATVTLTGALATSVTLPSRVANSGTYQLSLARLPSDGSYYRIDWGNGDVTDVTTNPASGNVLVDYNFAGPGHFKVVTTRYTPTATPGTYTTTVVDTRQLLIGDRGVRADVKASVDFTPTRNQRGLIVFDYVADNDYKFAGLLDTGGRREFVIGRVTPTGGAEFNRVAYGSIVQKLSHTYADDSGATNRTINASLTRTALPNVAATPLTLRVLNEKPVVDLIPPATVTRSVSAVFGVKAVRDPGTDTITSHTINWGDGQSQTFAGRPTVSASTFAHTYANTGSFTITITVVDEDGTHTAATVPITVVLPDSTPPTIASSQVLFQDFQGVSVTFSEPLDPASVAANDLQVLNLGTNVTTTPVSVVLSNGNTVATWRFNNAGTFLADGNYRFTLPANAVRDVAQNGNALATIQNATTFFLAADANRSRTVNFDDLLVLAANYNTTGRTFAQGNFNYSAAGEVNFDDLLTLAARYNQTLAGGPAGLLVAPPSPSSGDDASDDAADPSSVLA
jgi:subtilisin-like proprotein convertase family protein